MAADRYLKIVLTVIALELGWIAVKDSAVQVSAQAGEPMPVLIRGVEILPGKDTSLPVTLVRTNGPVRVNSDRPLQVEAQRPLPIHADRPLVVETDQRPLLIQSVPAVPAARPGPGN
jgi:hypothetical protein